MQKRVQRKEVDIVIANKDSPHKGKVIVESERQSPLKSPAKNSVVANGYEMPDVHSLAGRYGVSLHDLDDATDRQSAADTQLTAQSQLTNDFAAAMQTMQQKLMDKNRKIEELCVMLEALEPVSGGGISSKSAARFDESDPNVDMRDQKIVSLAKKAHRLTMTVNKERSTNDRLTQELQEARQRIESLSTDLQDAQSTVSALRKDGKKVYNRHALVDQSQREEEEQERQTKEKQARDAMRSVETLKEQMKKLQDENKKLTKALEREIGENQGVTIEQAIEGTNWRGRAQQIVMLKAKVKQLENMSNRLDNGTRNARDVDTKAEEELMEMSRERRMVVEQLTEERIKLIENNQSLEKKASAQKARIQILESESRKLKENIQVALDKSSSDDQLLDALRAEIARLRAKLQLAIDEKMQSTSSAALSGSLSARRSGGYNPADRLEQSAEWQQKEEKYKADLLRLQRLCKNQAEQLDSQDATIKELRKQLH